MLSEEDLKEFYEDQLRQRQKEYSKTKSSLIDEQIELLQKLAGNQIKILMGQK